MKQTKVLLLIASAIMLLQSCSQKNSVFWVSGVKTECTSGMAKTECLNIYKGEDLNNPVWENFHPHIKGFEFEEGYMQKIKVKEIQSDAKETPADASSVKYELVEVLEKQKDTRTELNGDWTLTQINNATIKVGTAIPSITIDLSKRKLSANGGCNSFAGEIQAITKSEISLGMIIGTKKACLNKNIETDFREALDNIKTYQVKDETLTFFNESGNKILTFTKGKISQKLHNIWVATRINGQAIKESSPMPRLEINLIEMVISGDDGCNNYHGVIEELTDSKLVFGNIATSLKLCEEMEIPDKFNNAMINVRSYKQEGLNLILFDENDKEVLFCQKLISRKTSR